MLQGQVAGLNIVRADGGDPNGDFEIQLRGMTTMAGGASPLVVIDGVVGGDLSNVSPDDIASIDVLKDGSAAAIYGTRGTNGVILVTTKKPMRGEPYRILGLCRHAKRGQKTRRDVGERIPQHDPAIFPRQSVVVRFRRIDRLVRRRHAQTPCKPKL
ncbi:MAG: TonB-dependent receptor plug domain-containing protein [Alistipes onderdonkii]